MSSLGVEESGTWMAVLYYKGCPGCLKVLTDGDEFKTAILTQDSVVQEVWICLHLSVPNGCS